MSARPVVYVVDENAEVRQSLGMLLEIVGRTVGIWGGGVGEGTTRQSGMGNLTSLRANP